MTIGIVDAFRLPAAVIRVAYVLFQTLAAGHVVADAADSIGATPLIEARIETLSVEAGLGQRAFIVMAAAG